MNNINMFFNIYLKKFNEFSIKEFISFSESLGILIKVRDKVDFNKKNEKKNYDKEIISSQRIEIDYKFKTDDKIVKKLNCKSALFLTLYNIDYNPTMQQFKKNCDIECYNKIKDYTYRMELNTDGYGKYDKLISYVWILFLIKKYDAVFIDEVKEKIAFSKSDLIAIAEIKLLLKEIMLEIKSSNIDNKERLNEAVEITDYDMNTKFIIEITNGYANNTEYYQRKIFKIKKLMEENKEIKNVQWIFVKNKISNNVGPSVNLMNLLNVNNIQVILK